MKKLRFLVSLTTNDNDYQIEQAVSAEDAARRLGVDPETALRGYAGEFRRRIEATEAADSDPR